MRAAWIMALLGLSSPAMAGRHCAEVSAVVGYQRCSRFGTEWTGGTLSWELGLTIQRIPFDPIDKDVDVMQAGNRTSYRVHAPGSIGSATGLRLRDIYGLADHFYVTSELTLGRLTVGPQLDISPVARTAMPIENATTGVLVEGLLAAGARSSLGVVHLGTELAFGPRAVLYSNDRLQGALFNQSGLLVEARAHASMWLSMHWTIGVMAATSVIDRHDVSMTLSLGLHAFPYDGGA